MTNKITFENLPEAITELHNKVDRLLSQIKLNNQPDEADKLLTIQEFIDYLPERPAKQTVYGWVNDRLVPYEKYGKRLYFRKSNIDSWLSKGRQV